MKQHTGVNSDLHFIEYSAQEASGDIQLVFQGHMNLTLLQLYKHQLQVINKSLTEPSVRVKIQTQEQSEKKMNKVY